MCESVLSTQNFIIKNQYFFNKYVGVWHDHKNIKNKKSGKTTMVKVVWCALWGVISTLQVNTEGVSVWTLSLIL